MRPPTTSTGFPDFFADFFADSVSSASGVPMAELSIPLFAFGAGAAKAAGAAEITPPTRVVDITTDIALSRRRPLTPSGLSACFTCFLH
ncbi:hypothetical protein ADK99_10220 [Streptomyces sp. MMG1064]|nr:hypothetical protein ADK99_10220 [Streptomyces sp. MMG1064]